MKPLQQPYGFALAGMKAGARYRRTAWPAGYWVAIVRDGRASIGMAGKSGEVRFSPFIVMFTKGTLTPYTPTQSDQLAEDWIPFDEAR